MILPLPVDHLECDFGNTRKGITEHSPANASMAGVPRFALFETWDSTEGSILVLPMTKQPATVLTLLVPFLANPQSHLLFHRKRLARIDPKLRFQRKRVRLERNREMGVGPQEGAHK
jgi:hypothetical protein